MRSTLPIALRGSASSDRKRAGTLKPASVAPTSRWGTAGRTVTKEEIFAEIWGDRIVSDAALSSQIKTVRRALDDDGTSQRVIATVHGRGFRFVRPITMPSQTTAPREEKVKADAALAALAERPCVAVLPLVNGSREPSEDYLADGISEDIITALAKQAMS